MGMPLPKARGAFPPCKSHVSIGLVSSLPQNMNVKLSESSSLVCSTTEVLHADISQYTCANALALLTGSGVCTLQDVGQGQLTL